MNKNLEVILRLEEINRRLAELSATRSVLEDMASKLDCLRKQPRRHRRNLHLQHQRKRQREVFQSLPLPLGPTPTLSLNPDPNLNLVRKESGAICHLPSAICHFPSLREPPPRS